MNTTIDQTKLLRVKYQNAYDAGRKNTLLAILLTYISIALLAFAGIYLYFSAYLPVSLAASGAQSYYLDTLNPTDVELLEEGLADEVFEAYRQQLADAGDTKEYTDEELYAMGVANEVIADYRADLAAYQAETDGMMDLIIGISLALIITTFYLVCWLLSKKHPVWMIVLTVAYVLDTVLVALDLPAYLAEGDVITAVFLLLYHAWVLYYLFSAMIAGNKLKKLPAPIEGEAVEIPVVETFAIPTAESVSAEESAPVESDNNSEV